MTLNGKDIDFKITRAKDAEAFRIAVEAFAAAAGEFERAAREGKQTIGGLIERRIGLVRDFFLTATGEDVLADCDDMQLADETYMKFISLVNEQSKAVRKNVLYPVK